MDPLFPRVLRARRHPSGPFLILGRERARDRAERCRGSGRGPACARPGRDRTDCVSPRLGRCPLPPNRLCLPLPGYAPVLCPPGLLRGAGGEWDGRVLRPPGLAGPAEGSGGPPLTHDPTPYRPTSATTPNRRHLDDGADPPTPNRRHGNDRDSSMMRCHVAAPAYLTAPLRWCGPARAQPPLNPSVGQNRK